MRMVAARQGAQSITGSAVEPIRILAERFDRIEAQGFQRGEEWFDLISELAATPAVTAGGCRIKADILQRLIAVMRLPDTDVVAKLAGSLAHDILRTKRQR